MQGKALKTAGGDHFVSNALSAARSSYLSAWQLITRAYPYWQAMNDEEVVTCIKLDDPKAAINYSEDAILLHPLATFSDRSMAKAYYTIGVGKFNSRKLGAPDLGARMDLLKAWDLEDRVAP